MYAGSQAMGVSVAGTAQIFRAAVRWSPPATRWIWRLTRRLFCYLRQRGQHFLHPRRMFETDKNGYIVNASGAYLQGFRSMTLALCKPVRSPISRSKRQYPGAGQQQPDFYRQLRCHDDAIDRTTVPFDATNSSSYTTATPPRCMTH